MTIGDRRLQLVTGITMLQMRSRPGDESLEDSRHHRGLSGRVSQTTAALMAGRSYDCESVTISCLAWIPSLEE